MHGDYGTYQIVILPSVLVRAAGEGGRGWGLTLDDVENWLATAALPTVEVILESESNDADRLAVAEVFESSGIWADVKGAYVRRSAGVLPWIIEIILGGGIVRFLWGRRGWCRR